MCGVMKLKILNENSFEDVRVLVIGDIMLDEYIYGDVVKISPEAPIPVIKVNKRTCSLGGAANVAVNLRELGCQVSLSGIIGKGRDSRTIKRLCRNHNINIEGVIAGKGRYLTTTKTRIMCQLKQIARYDIEDVGKLSDNFLNQFENHTMLGIKKTVPDYDIVIISDYNKGVLTDDLCFHLIHHCIEKDIPVLVDPKGDDWDKYKKATWITPNEKEFKNSYPGAFFDEILDSTHRMLKIPNILLTQSRKGMTYYLEGYYAGFNEKKHYFPAKTKEVSDVTGAGDTVIATLAAALGAGFNNITAVRLSNIAASIVVGKSGTQPVKIRELINKHDAFKTNK